MQIPQFQSGMSPLFMLAGDVLQGNFGRRVPADKRHNTLGEGGGGGGFAPKGSKDGPVVKLPERPLSWQEHYKKHGVGPPNTWKADMDRAMQTRRDHPSHRENIDAKKYEGAVRSQKRPSAKDSAQSSYPVNPADVAAIRAGQRPSYMQTPEQVRAAQEANLMSGKQSTQDFNNRVARWARENNVNPAKAIDYATKARVAAEAAGRGHLPDPMVFYGLAGAAQQGLLF